MAATAQELAAINANTDAINQILDEAKAIYEHNEQVVIDQSTFILGQQGTNTPQKLEIAKIVAEAAGSTTPAGVEGDVQLNIGSAFGSIAGYNYDSATDTLSFPMSIDTRAITLGPANETVDFEGGDFTGTGFTTDGDQDWFVDNVTAFEGSFSARSGAIIGSQVSNLYKTVTVSDAENAIKFAYFTDTEENGDFLEFYIDDELKAFYSGSNSYLEPNWTEVLFPVTPGTYNLKWVYRKDPNTDTGTDVVRIDIFQTFELFTSATFNGSSTFNGLSIFNDLIEFRGKVLGFKSVGDILVNKLKIGNGASNINSNIIIDAAVNQSGQLLTESSRTNTVIGANAFGSATDANGCSGFGSNGLRDCTTGQNLSYLGQATLRGVVDGQDVVGLGNTTSDLASNLSNTFFVNIAGTRYITIDTGGASVPDQTNTKINTIGNKAIITKEYADANYGAAGGGKTLRAGEEPAINFTGNPKIATVTFSSPLATVNYTPNISFETPDAYSPSYENKTVNGFDINLRSNQAPTNAVGWTASLHG